MVRVREQVESARESELDTIAQLSMFLFPFFSAYICLLSCAHHLRCSSVNRCQSSIQKTIGEPAHAREATTMHASLAVLTERLHTLEDKMNSKLDALTAVESSPMLSAEETPNRSARPHSLFKLRPSYRNLSKSSFRTPKSSRAES
jgi:hypothetical protein